MRKLAGLLPIASLGLLMSSAEAEERVDTTQRRVRKAIAERMTPEELQAYRERAARNRELRRSMRAMAAVTPLPDTPADTCPAATHENSSLPFGPVSDTTVGMTNDYEPASSMTQTCSAPSNCTGRPSGRGEVYLGTGWGPDRAYRIRTDANCTLTIDLLPTDTGLGDADDLGLLVYESQCSSDLSDCVCASDTGFPGGPGGNNEQVVLDAVAGQDYFVVIDGYSSAGAPPGDAGPFSLTISGTGCRLLSPATSYFTIPPCRLIDTRGPAGPFGGPGINAGASRTFQASAGACGIPATATALFLNVTVVSPTVAGFLQIFPTGGTPPTVSAVNYSANQVRGNNGVYALDAMGRFDIRAGQASGSVQVVVDVAGYFEE